jgi:hypothetical protein
VPKQLRPLDHSIQTESTIKEIKMSRKIKICIEHINEIFESEDLSTTVDFGVFRVVSGSLTQPCELLGDDEEHLTEPLDFNDHIYPLYKI